MVFDIFIAIMFAVYVIYNEHKRIKLLKHMLGIINIQNTTVGIINIQNTTVGLIVDCIEHANSILDILKEKDKSNLSA